MRVGDNFASVNFQTGVFMPLVALEEIETMIFSAIAKSLREAGKFAAIEAEAAKIIRDMTGLAIPESVSERPQSADWVIAPSAWIIQWMASHGVTDSEFLERRFETQYKDALKILKAHPLQELTDTGAVKTARSGIIEGLYE